MNRRHEEGNDEVPSLHEVLKGEIASLQTYGAFVRLAGYQKQGLVHISQISNSKVENTGDVLEKGESIWCKVISVSDGKVGLSMKLVSQTTGRDLDAANVQLSLDEQKRKSGHRHGSAPIQLHAVYDSTCRKCGGSGHLAQDCFYAPGGKKYDLVEVEEKPIFGGPNQLRIEQRKKESKHKKKKEKHKKKHKRKQETNSDSESDSPKREKQKKKKRKHSHREDKSDGDESLHKRPKEKHKRKRKQSRSSSE